jgi:Transposase zinc-binding domain
LCRLVQQHAATLIAETIVVTRADLPQFVTDEFDALLECRILANGFLTLRCGGCGHDKFVAFSFKRGFCPSREARCVAQTASSVVDHVIPHMPVRQWVLALPIHRRLLLAAQPKLVKRVLKVVRRVINRLLLMQAGLRAGQPTAARQRSSSVSARPPT